MRNIQFEKYISQNIRFINAIKLYNSSYTI